MPDIMSFAALGGLSPQEYVIQLKNRHRPTQADNLALAQLGITKILKLTERGVDANGTPFAPYSTRGPIYVYPNSAGSSKATSKQRHGASSRFAKAIGRPGTKINGRVGLKFASYADYKAAISSGTVNLQGPNNHMLRAMQPKADANSFTVGIYDEKLATIATAHNEGAQTGRGRKVRLPRRHFFDFSRATMAELSGWLTNLLDGRIREK